MKIEHIALNVADPVSLAQWYVDHLGFRIKRSMPHAPFAHFLADQTDAVMIELYHNPNAPVPDYTQQHPLILHLAMQTNDLETDRQRLLDAGATAVGPVDNLDDGDVLAMLRDPGGLAIQLVKRREPMV